MEKNYYRKYLKYKNKYIQLKNKQQGGFNTPPRQPSMLSSPLSNISNIMYQPGTQSSIPVTPAPQKKQRPVPKFKDSLPESPPERGDTIDTLALNDDFTEVDVVYLNKKKFEITLTKKNLVLIFFMELMVIPTFQNQFGWEFKIQIWINMEVLFGN